MIVSNRFASRLLVVAVGALAFLALPGKATAQSQAKLDVSFDVPVECDILGGKLQFNVADYTGLTDLDKSTNIKVFCRRAETVIISFSGSTGRELINQLNTFSKLRYALFEDPTNFAALGGGGATISRSVAAGTTVNVTVSARVFAGQQGLLVSGLYSDTVTMTLTI
jgi:spore coat protein U-like protein